MSAQKDRFENYIPVAERVEQFYSKHPTGRINTSIIEHDQEHGFILMRADVYRLTDDAQPSATGHAYELRGEGYVNKTSYIENCETGAVGRALAMLGFEVKRGIASREEMQKSERQQPAQAPRPTPLPAQKKVTHEELENEILDVWTSSGGTAASLQKWVQTNYETQDLGGLSIDLKRDILTQFKQKAAAKSGR